LIEKVPVACCQTACAKFKIINWYPRILLLNFKVQKVTWQYYYTYGSCKTSPSLGYITLREKGKMKRARVDGVRLLMSGHFPPVLIPQLAGPTMSLFVMYRSLKLADILLQLLYTVHYTVLVRRK
jgi:hypothetical protein